MVLNFENPIIEVIAKPLIIFLASLVIAYIAKKVSSKYLKHYAYVSLKVESYLPSLIILLGIMLALSQLGLAINVLLLFIGIFGIALLIGFRFALENILSRVALDFTPTYKVGDWLHIREFFGKVVEINALNTQLLSEEGEVITIPNSVFLREITSNKSLSAVHEITIPITLPKEIDAVKFEKILLEECAEMHRYLRKKPQPRIVTLKVTDAEEELSLITMLKDPEYKSIVLEQLKNRIKKITDQLTVEAKRKRFK